MRKDTLIFRVSLCALTCVLSLACKWTVTARPGTQQSSADYDIACELLTQLKTAISDGKRAEAEARIDHDWAKAIEIRQAQADKVAEIRESRLLRHASQQRLNEFKIHPTLEKHCGLKTGTKEADHKADSGAGVAGGSGEQAPTGAGAATAPAAR